MWQTAAGARLIRHTVGRLRRAFIVSYQWKFNGLSGLLRIPVQSQACELTVNNHSRRRAPSFGHDVLGHTRVVGCVWETRLLDDQVVVDGDVEVPVLRRVNYLLVLPPLHLRGGEQQRRKNELRAVVSLQLCYGARYCPIELPVLSGAPLESLLPVAEAKNKLKQTNKLEKFFAFIL